MYIHDLQRLKMEGIYIPKLNPRFHEGLKHKKKPPNERKVRENGGRACLRKL